MWLKASAEDTGSAFSLLEAIDGAKFATPIHIHRNAAEAFYILEGEYTIFLEGQRFSCSAGSFIFIPSGIPHAFRVGNEAGRKLNLYVPAAMVGYFEDWNAAIDQGVAVEDLRRVIAKRYSLELVGPAPED